MRKLLYLSIVMASVFLGCNKYTDKPDDISEYQEFEQLITGVWKVQEMELDSCQYMYYEYYWNGYPQDTTDTNDVYSWVALDGYASFPTFYLTKHKIYSLSSSILHYVGGDTIVSDSMFGASRETYAKKFTYTVPAEFYVTFKENHTWNLTGIKTGSHTFYRKDTVHRQLYFCSGNTWTVYADSVDVTDPLPDTIVYAEGSWKVINKDFIQIEGGIFTGIYDISGNELVKQPYRYSLDWPVGCNCWWTYPGEEIFLYADTHIVSCQYDYGICNVTKRHYQGPYSWQIIQSYFKMNKQ